MKKAVAWVLLLTLGMILIVVGVRGNPGSALAALITPTKLIDTTS